MTKNQKAVAKIMDAWKGSPVGLAPFGVAELSREIRRLRRQVPKAFCDGASDRYSFDPKRYGI